MTPGRPPLARRRSRSLRAGQPSEDARAGLEPRSAPGERRRCGAADRRRQQQLVRRLQAAEADRLLAGQEALRRPRQQTCPDAARQLTAVERRGDEHVALHDPHVGGGRFEHVAVEIDEERQRAQALLEPCRQPAVDPLVLAQPAGEQRGGDRDRSRDCALRQRSGLDLDRQRTAHPWPGAYPQAGVAVSAGRFEDRRLQLLRQRLAVERRPRWRPAGRGETRARAPVRRSPSWW